MSGTDYVTTPNLGLFKPIYDHDVEMWGTHLNANCDLLDAQFSPTAGVFLPIAGGTMTGPLVLTATGGTVGRSAQNRAADVVNAKDFGTVADGVTNDSAAIQAAITYAASLSPPRPVYAPAGTYLIGTQLSIAATKTGQRLYGDEGGTIFLLGPANASVPGILTIGIGTVGLTIEGIIFDGNSANSATNQSMTQLTGAWSDRITFRRCHFRNGGTAINAPGDQPISGNVSVQCNPGQPTLTFAAAPANVFPGAYVTGSTMIDPDMYVVSTTATTVTLNRNLTDTLLSGSSVSFTHAFTTSADAFYGDTVILTANTTGLSVGQTLYIAGNGCFQTTTRITAIATNASVTVDKFLLNKLPSGSNVAAMRGHSRLTVQDCIFANLGQKGMYGSTTTYNTSGVQASGQNTLVLRCKSTSGATLLGPYPGQFTGASPPAGVPANTLIRDIPSRNTAANTYTITLASPLTASIADNTPIPFQTAQASVGYGLWLSWGACFANVDAKIINNRFEHTWVSCLFVTGTGRTLCMGNTYVEDQMEYRDPSIAPSAHIACAGTMHMRIVGDCGIGCTGHGVESQHPVGMVISGCDFSYGGLAGIAVMCGHDNVVNGVVLADNGQYLNIPLVQDYIALNTYPHGLIVSGSQSFGQAGAQSATVVSGVAASDDQAIPTQYYGIQQWSALSTYNNLSISGYVGTGNVVATLDPALLNVSGRQAPRLLYQTSTLAGNGADLTQDVLQTFSVPANTLVNVGDRLVIRAGGAFTSSTDSKVAAIRWGGSNCASMTVNTASQQIWRLDGEILKTGPNTQTISMLFASNSSITNAASTTTTRTDTAAIAIDITGQNTTNSVASSITCRYFTVDYVAGV